MARIYQKVGANIKKLRGKAKLSQEKLAEKAKLDLTSISEIESGLRNPSLKTLSKLARGLKIPLSNLLE